MATLADTLRKTRKLEPMRIWLMRPELILTPQIPKPMHGLAPRVIYGDKWWDATRKAAYKSTNYHCIICGVSKYKAKYHQWLEGHELYKINYWKGWMTYLETVPLCHFCHNSIHAGRLKALLDRGEVHQAKYVAIIQHRDRLIERYNLALPQVYIGEMPEWSKWRLILDRKRYKPLFKSYEEWEANWRKTDE